MISRSSADSNDTLMKTRSDTASDWTDSDSRAHRVAAAEAEEAEEAEAEAEEAAYEQRLTQDRIERISGSAPTVSVSGAALGGSHAASDATSSMSRCVPLTNPFSPICHTPFTLYITRRFVWSSLGGTREDSSLQLAKPSLGGSSVAAASPSGAIAIASTSGAIAISAPPVAMERAAALAQTTVAAAGAVPPLEAVPAGGSQPSVSASVEAPASIIQTTDPSSNRASQLGQE